MGKGGIGTKWVLELREEVRVGQQKRWASCGVAAIHAGMAERSFACEAGKARNGSQIK